MKAENTALILIGFQNDYFAEDGILHEVVEESLKVTKVLENTISLMESFKPKLVVSTPIIFTEDYSELSEPVGILKTITEVKAFKKGTSGAETIADFEKFNDQIIEVPGKIGLNAFSNTNLDALLRENKIENVVLAGVVSSICIDSTGRSAFEKGYKVTVLSDCTSGRTTFEQDFYCDHVFPLYSMVTNSKSLITQVDYAG